MINPKGTIESQVASIEDQIDNLRTIMSRFCAEQSITSFGDVEVNVAGMDVPTLIAFAELVAKCIL